jgi:hypothetical protein
VCVCCGNVRFVVLSCLCVNGVCERCVCHRPYHRPNFLTLLPYSLNKYLYRLSQLFVEPGRMSFMDLLINGTACGDVWPSLSVHSLQLSKCICAAWRGLLLFVHKRLPLPCVFHPPLFFVLTCSMWHWSPFSGIWILRRPHSLHQGWSF